MPESVAIPVSAPAVLPLLPESSPEPAPPVGTAGKPKKCLEPAREAKMLLFVMMT